MSQIEVFTAPEFDTERLRAHEVGLTPEPVTRQWIEVLARRRSAPRTILIPGAGSGVEAKVCRETWPDAYIVAIEPRAEEHRHLARYCDEVWSCTFEEWADRVHEDERFDLIVTNPPFSKARPAEVDGKVVTWIDRRDELLEEGGLLTLLMPNDFLDRTRVEVAWLLEVDEYGHCPNAPIRHSRIADRVGFYGGSGTDSNTHGWWTWMRSDHDGFGGQRSGRRDLNSGGATWLCEQLPWLPGHERKWKRRPGTED